MKNLVYIILLSLFLVSFSSVIQAGSVTTVYINNKPFTGKIYLYGDTLYVEGSLLLSFMNIPHSTTATNISIKDPVLQEKLSKIAVWVDYKDGRGNVISFPLKTVAEVMGGRYTYYSDTNTVDMVSFSRTNQANTTNTVQPQTNSTVTTPSSGVSASNPAGHSSGDIVNPFNTSKILNDAQNTVNLYQDQNGGK